MKRTRSASKGYKKRRDPIENAQYHQQSDGLSDLPVEVAVVIEGNARTTEESKAVTCDEPVESLVSRLEAIRERIWRLQAMFAVSLSHDCAIEANQYLHRFQTLALQLKERDVSAFDNLVRGHESLLLSPPVPVKQTIPVETQRLCELRWEVNRLPAQSEGGRTTEHVPDGLGWML